MRTDRMRIYFAPCGMGLGHVGRTVPIARKLVEKGATVTFSTYQEGLRYIENARLPLIRAPALGVQTRPDGTIDFRRTAINPGPFMASFDILSQVRSEIRSIQSFKPDIVISDSRASSLLAARILRIPSACILNQFQVMIPRRTHHLFLAKLADSATLTLIGKIWTSGNTVLIPDFPYPYTISAGNLNIPETYRKRVKLIGPILEVNPKSLRSKEELRKELGLPLDKTIVFVPISGSTKEKAFLTGILRKILLGFPGNFEIVLSLGYPDTSSMPVRYRNMVICKWVPNRFEYLKACDILIARAGHGTITQAMCYAKPILLIPTPGHTEQISNARKACDLGVAKIIRQEDLSKGRLLTLINELEEGNMSASLEAIQSEALKHDGLENAVNAIGEILK